MSGSSGLAEGLELHSSTAQASSGFHAALAEMLVECYADPLRYVMAMFPWDADPTIQVVKLPAPWCDIYDCEYGPDGWACEFLEQLGEEIRVRNFNGRDPVAPIQFSTASGHGIGKSVMVAWLTKFILDTRPMSRGTLTASTAEQLKTKTWAELGKWHRRSLTYDYFNYTSGRGAMALRHKRHPEEWFATGQTCREENSESFAGQHAANSTSFYQFDEASGVPDKIYEVREGGTTDGEPMTFDWGNPTRNTGRFYENTHPRGRFVHRYISRAIDSRTVSITNKERLQAWVDDWGIDSDYVKVRVLGQFPAMGTLQFISTESVIAAQQRDVVEDRYAPLVIGVDVARFGDDESVIWPRVGDDARTWAPRAGDGRYRGIDTMMLADKVVAKIKFFEGMGMKCQALFVDGTGVGGGVVDRLRQLGWSPIEVQFGAAPADPKTYRYKSDELWGNLKDAINARLVLPRPSDHSGVELFRDLTQRQFGHTLGKGLIHLEPKADMKLRLGNDCSPNCGDALALTYTSEIGPVTDPRGQQLSGVTVKSDYDPLKEED